MSVTDRIGLPAPGTRVVVAMSGGVDSSVAAALLVEHGCDVVGISMRLAGQEGGDRDRRSSGCCSIEDFRDAGRVATKLGMPHYVFDMREQFARSVVQPFVDEYLRGRTPSPCVLCNREIKFNVLRRKAAELGAPYVATGHYARREFDGSRYRLLCGRDRDKDQSYFLFEMGQAELAGTLFPVGALAKEEVRRLAERFELPVAHKPDSQEICFVPDGRYADFVEKLGRSRVREGEIRDERGRTLGRHGGVQRFTVGQRRGLGLSSSQPLYVDAIDGERGIVTVAHKPSLRRAGLLADGVVWTSGEAECAGARLHARIRYRHTPVGATLRDVRAAGATLVFDEPQEAVSPGQAVVLYRDDEVVGGGWIRAALTGAEASACA